MRRQRPRGILRRGVSNTLIVFKSIVVGRMQLNIFVELGVVPKTTVKMDDLSTKSITQRLKPWTCEQQVLID